MARKSRPLPTQEELTAALFYELDYGYLSAKFPSPFRVRFFNLSGGYVQVYLNGVPYLAHRLIWKMMTGNDPIEIDHIDGDPSNNAWSNLRHATSAENNRNRRLSSRNASSVKGVCWEASRGKWRATIGDGRNPEWIRRFDDLAEAERHVIEARTRLHGEFARNL